VAPRAGRRFNAFSLYIFFFPPQGCFITQTTLFVFVSKHGNWCRKKIKIRLNFRFYFYSPLVLHAYALFERVLLYNLILKSYNSTLQILSNKMTVLLLGIWYIGTYTRQDSYFTAFIIKTPRVSVRLFLISNLKSMANNRQKM